VEPVKNIQGNAIPLNRADVDTDQIMPKQFLKRIERSGFGPFTFFDWRKDPSFVLNNPAYEGAPILVAGPNFGCGSSREHAPWGLEDMGIKAVIAPSFADIFRNNCAKIGLLTVALPQDDVDYLIARAEELPGGQVQVSLEQQTVSVQGTDWVRHFDVDPFVKDCLLNGLDDIGLTLKHDDAIAAFEATRSELLPTAAK
jgi:3-isopropylmalate/(R)-2-methylmalate dehydratase small subunit